MYRGFILTMLLLPFGLFAQVDASDSTVLPVDTLQATTEELVTPSMTEPADSAALLPLNLPKEKFKVSRVRILLGLDYSYYTPFLREKDTYKGPFISEADSATVWLNRSTDAVLSRDHRISNIQFSLQANFWKGLFLGMNYHFMSIRNFKKEPGSGNFLAKDNTVFFLVSANIGYAFDLLKNKSLQIHPSVRIGGYTGDGYYDNGNGKKIHLGTDLKIRYLIKRKFGLGIGINYDMIRYQRKGFNDQFQLPTYQKIWIHSIHLHAGISFNITIRTKP